MIARRIVKTLLVLAASFLEVHVRAASLQEPKNCLKQNMECAVYVGSGIENFRMGAAEVRLSAGASVVRRAPDLLRVVKGSVLVKVNGAPLKFETLFAAGEVKDGSFLIEAGDEVAKLTNLTAEARYRPRGHAGDLDLPKGLMNEVGRVGTTGQAVTSYPRSMSLKPLIETWARFYRKDEFKTLKADFEHFVPHWRAGLDFVGPWYLETVTREIAEHKAELERLRRLREERQREEKYYREMFRRKNFLD